MQRADQRHQKKRLSLSRCTEKSVDCAKPRPNYCSICKIGFACNKSLRNHNSGSRHRRKAKKFESVKVISCQVCCIELSSEKQLQDHLKGKNHKERVKTHHADMEGTLKEDDERFKFVSHQNQGDSSLKFGIPAPRSSSQEFNYNGKSSDKDGRTEDRSAQISAGAEGSNVLNQKVILETLLQSNMFSPQFIMAANLEASRLLNAQDQTLKSAKKKKKAASSRKQHLKGVRHNNNDLKGNEKEGIVQDQARSQHSVSSGTGFIIKQEPGNCDEKRLISSKKIEQPESYDVRRKSSSCSQNKRKHPEDVSRQLASEGNSSPLARNVNFKGSLSDSSKRFKGFTARSSSRSSLEKDSEYNAKTKPVKSHSKQKNHEIDNKTFSAKENATVCLRSSLSGSEVQQERNIHRKSTFTPRRVHADEQKGNVPSTECQSRNVTESRLKRRQREVEHNHRGYKRETNSKTLHSLSDSLKQCRRSSTRSSSRSLSEMDTRSKQVAVESAGKRQLYDKTSVTEKHSHRQLRSSHSGSEPPKGEQKVHRERTYETSSQVNSHYHKDDSRNVRRNSDSYLETRRREGDQYQEVTASKAGKLNSGSQYTSGHDVRLREHYTRQAKRGLVSVPRFETRQVHEEDCQGSTSTLHGRRITENKDQRRLDKTGFCGLEDVQRNAEIRGSTYVRGPQASAKMSERGLAPQTHGNVGRMRHGNCEVDPILRSKSIPEHKQGGFQIERHPAAPTNIWERTVVYDYNHGLDEGLDENSSRQLPSSHNTAKASQTLDRFQFGTGNETVQQERAQDRGDVLDHSTQTKRQRVLGGSFSVPDITVNTESISESDDEVKVKKEAGTIGTKRGSSRPEGSPAPQPVQKPRNRVTNAKEKLKNSKVEQSRGRSGRNSSHTNGLRKQARAPNKKVRGKSDELGTGTKSKRTKEDSGMVMLPLEHIEKQRAKVLKILNFGTQYDIENLNGVGKKRARMIIQWRQAVGGFKSVAELSNILGFGEKMLKAILL